LPGYDVEEDFGTTQYAAAVKGLCGCTTIFAASPKGAFSSHIWEENKNDHKDLQPKNYKNSLKDLTEQLTPHKAALTGGEAFIILPRDPQQGGSKPLYAQEIVDAIISTVSSASGLNPKVTWYTPLDWKADADVLGTSQRGTGAVQYDPSYKDDSGKKHKAYRIYSENTLLSEKTW
jgi:hypothetical protein